MIFNKVDNLFTVKIHDFYRRFTRLPLQVRDTILKDIRPDPLTPFLIYKQLEEVRKMQRYYQKKEEELLRIADETFNQVEL